MANQKRHWIALDPNDIRVDIPDLKKFCAEKGLTYSNMYRALSDPDKKASSYGYRAHPDQKSVTKAIAEDMFILFNRALQRSTSYTTSRPTLAAESGISSQSVWRLISGQVKQVRGWEISNDMEKVPDFDSDIETQSIPNDTPSPDNDVIVHHTESQDVDSIDILPGEEDL